MLQAREYRVLKKQFFSSGSYSLVPIRLEDCYQIMQWRNEQIYHLRQIKPLTKEDQDQYFEKVVAKIFDQEKPDQILFSFLQDEKCIGYGGLVHINWIDLNAEISFIMDTSLESDLFEFHWERFLSLIEKAAFQEIKLHKLFVFSFDIRPHLYKVLENNNYFKDAVLKEHCRIDDYFKDVVIYSKITSL